MQRPRATLQTEHISQVDYLPVLKMSVALVAPTTHGKPYSLATTAPTNTSFC